MENKKVRFSFATYIDEDGNFCRIDDLAKILSCIANVPKHINDIKAKEISLLARDYISIKTQLRLAKVKLKQERAK